MTRAASHDRQLPQATACKPPASRYTAGVAETTATGRENPSTIGGRAAAHAAIFSSALRLCAPVFYGGPGEGQLRLGRFPMGRFLTPRRQARHHSRENERRASNLSIGGRTLLRHIPARPEQTQSPNRFPLFVRAGREAAALWLQFAPLTAAEFRDVCFRNLVAGLGRLPDFTACRDAFEEAFARAIALDIAAASRAEVRHAA